MCSSKPFFFIIFCFLLLPAVAAAAEISFGWDPTPAGDTIWTNNGDWTSCDDGVECAGNVGGRLAVVISCDGSEAGRKFNDPSGATDQHTVSLSFTGRARCIAQIALYQGAKWQSGTAYTYGSRISPDVDQPDLAFRAMASIAAETTEPNWFPRTISAGSASNTGSGTVLIPVTAHGLKADDEIMISGTDNFDASGTIDLGDGTSIDNLSHTLPEQTNGDANHVEITVSYAAETFDGTETITPTLIRAQRRYLTASGSSSVGQGDPEVGPLTVLIPCTAHGYSAGDLIYLKGTANYDGWHSLPEQEFGDANNIEILSSHTSETFDGSEYFYSCWQRFEPLSAPRLSKPTSRINLQSDGVSVKGIGGSRL